MPPRGRRPGTSGAREDILVAARTAFAKGGFTATSVRSIAEAASVDPALVHHYFGTKEELFAAVMRLPFDPADVVETIVTVPRAQLGQQLVRTFLDTWDSPPNREILVGLLRSATTDDKAASSIREFLIAAIYGPVVAAAGSGDPRLRVGGVAAQLIGLAMARFVVPVQPIAEAAIDEIVELYAPGVQHAITGGLGGASASRPAHGRGDGSEDGEPG